MLTFNSERHEYRWDDHIVPSVTQVLSPLFQWDKVPPHVLERKRQIGTAVHAAIHLELTVGVDSASIDPAVAPYFNAWKCFRDSCDFEPVLVEYRVWHPELHYAGTFDEWGMLNGEPALIDWKTSMHLNYEAVGAQTAAYLTALSKSGIGALSDKRFALKLGSDGGFKLEPYRSLHDDFNRFMRCLLMDGGHDDRSTATDPQAHA